MQVSNKKHSSSRQAPRRAVSALALAVALAAGLAASGCAVNPQPLDRDQIHDAIEQDQAMMDAMADPITGPLTLDQALARALKYNLDNRVKLMEEALSERGFELAKMDMLPVLAARAGYNNRSNVNASSSESVLTGTQSLEPSTSVDQDRHYADLELSWNVLDFGVSYLKAKQEADRYLIAADSRRNVMAKLLQETRTAYWRAAVTQQLSARIDGLLEETGAELDRMNEIQQRRLRSPMDVLQEKRQLLAVMRSLRSFRRTVDAAQIELAALINQPPGVHIELADSEQLPELPELPVDDLDTLEQVALAHSSDYTGQLYNARIAQREARKSLLRLLPGLEFSYGGHYDSNSYLYNDTWAEAGVRVSWNLLRLLALGDIRAQNEARDNLVAARRLAANMATVARVNLGWQQYRNALNDLTLSNEFLTIDEQIADYSGQARSSNAMSGTQTLMNEARALNSVLTNSLDYVKAQDAYGGFLFSLGFNPVPENYQSFDVQALSNRINTAFAEWTSGPLPIEAGSPWFTENVAGSNQPPLARATDREAAAQ
ncbi:TolC family protein [Alloalcanivorax sp. C16-1]|uniref:TolC family protein n=1 Tax=Alloalcanivorax sp. C16-1 TaxID=3390051 RepID=UPI003970852B